MAMLAHYDLDLHQMDVKTIIMNENLEEEFYIDLLECFSIEGKEYMECKLKKSVHGLRQVFQ